MKSKFIILSILFASNFLSLAYSAEFVCDETSEPNVSRKHSELYASAIDGSAESQIWDRFSLWIRSRCPTKWFHRTLLVWAGDSTTIPWCSVSTCSVVWANTWQPR